MQTQEELIKELFEIKEGEKKKKYTDVSLQVNEHPIAFSRYIKGHTNISLTKFLRWCDRKGVTLKVQEDER